MRDRTVLYLSRRDVESLGLDVIELVRRLEVVFLEKAAGRVAMPPKHWIERSPDTFYSAMTSYAPALHAAGCKWQSGDPRNTARGLSYILGVYILSEDETGLPIAIMDSTWITSMRTAAASVLTAKYLAREGLQVAAILGCGVQGRANLEALKAFFPSLEAARAYDIKAETAGRYAREMSRTLGMDVRAVSSPRLAVEGSDVIVTAGPIRRPAEPVIEPDWIAPGALGITLDYDAYWTPEAIAAMEFVCTDDIAQIAHLKEWGYFASVSTVHGELAEVIAGRIQGRKDADDRILAFNLGIALEDLATAVVLHQLAEERKIGTQLPL